MKIRAKSICRDAALKSLSLIRMDEDFRHAGETRGAANVVKMTMTDDDCERQIGVRGNDSMEIADAHPGVEKHRAVAAEDEVGVHQFIVVRLEYREDTRLWLRDGKPRLLEFHAMPSPRTSFRAEYTGTAGEARVGSL